MSSVAPLAIVTEPPGTAPSEAELFKRTVPAAIFVGPVYVLTPLRVTLPEPTCCSPPEPLMTALTVTASLRLKIRFPLSVIAPPPRLPAVPPVPTRSVPPLAIVVVPA